MDSFEIGVAEGMEKVAKLPSYLRHGTESGPHATDPFYSPKDGSWVSGRGEKNTPLPKPMAKKLEGHAKGRYRAKDIAEGRKAGKKPGIKGAIARFGSGGSKATAGLAHLETKDLRDVIKNPKKPLAHARAFLRGGLRAVRGK